MPLLLMARMGSGSGSGASGSVHHPDLKRQNHPREVDLSPHTHDGISMGMVGSDAFLLAMIGVAVDV